MSDARAVYFGVLVASGAAWGSTQSLSKIAVEGGHGPFGLILWQFVVGTALLGAILAVRGRFPPLTRATLGFAVLIAVIGTLLPNAASYIAIDHLPAGIMSIVIAAVPLLAFPIAVALGQDRIGTARIAGLLAGIGGVALIALPKAALPEGAAVGWLLLALVAPLFYAIESNYVALRGTAGMDAVQAMFLASAIGAVMAFPVVLARGELMNPFAPWGAAEVAITLSSIIHALAYSSYVWLAGRAGAVFAAQSSYVVTLTGVFWAMAILGERFSGWVWAALLLMILGLLLVQPRGRAAVKLQES
jgi:drug/metabolite transporter (DMT)-like permease